MEKRITSIVSYAFISLIFLLPIVFSASALFSFQFAKVVPLFLALFLGIFLLIIQTFNEGKLAFPKNWFFFALLAVPFSYILSSFFSVNPSGSFLGTGIETGTASFIGGMFILMYLVSLFVRSKDKIFIAYLSFGGAYIIIALFHIVRFFFGSSFLSFGIFTNVISNTVGRFTDLALISGIAVILSLTSLEFFRLGKVSKIAGYVVLSFSLLMLAITNFPIFVWGPSVTSTLSLMTLIGFFALVFFVYFVSSSYEQGKKSSDEDEVGIKKVRRVPIASLIVLVVSIIFTIGFAPLQGALSSYFKIDSGDETRLLWKPTADLSWSTLTEAPYYRPFIGHGPEQFSYKWLLDKPTDINNSIIWNGTFDVGSGFIPSAIVTVGLIGFLSWVAFLALFIWLGVKALFMKIKDPFSHYLTVSSFLVALYLWIVQIIYTPSIVLLAFTFIFTGLFIASVFREGIIKEAVIVFDKSKGRSFVLIMSLIIILIASLFWAYKIGERAVASMYAGQANIALQNAQSIQDVDKAKVYLESAGSLANPDLYARVLANISLAQVNSVLQDTTTESQELQAQFQRFYGQALQYAQVAVSIDPNSFDNFVTLGNVIGTLVSLEVPNSYENAKAAYEQARTLNPQSPLIPYLIARLEIDNGNIEGAKTRIGEALELKPNYLDALVLLGRIQVGEGNTEAAIASFTVAQNIDPQNQGIQAIINSLRNGDRVPVTPAATSTTQVDIEEGDE